jgi:hypothetical protein
MSKKKLNGYGLYVITDGNHKVSGYIDRPLDNGVHMTPILSFQKASEARAACEKLRYAGTKFGKWATLPSQALDILHTDLYPSENPIAWVICCRVSSDRYRTTKYVLREWTEQDADDLAHGEPDTSVIYEAVDYEQARFVRDLLRREYTLNGTRATSLTDVLATMKEYVNV